MSDRYHKRNIYGYNQNTSPDGCNRLRKAFAQSNCGWFEKRLTYKEGICTTDWPKLMREERRSIIESITEKITIGKGNEGTIEIELAYMPVQSS